MPDLIPYEDLGRIANILDLSHEEKGNTLYLLMDEHPEIDWHNDGDARFPIEEAYIGTLQKMKDLGMVSISWDDSRGRDQSVSYVFLVPKAFIRSLVRLEMIVHELMGSARNDI